ncbi:hypothetical protein QR680_006256 [Steinernema hermaphroditum]|uniref:TIL domain-containing protein n=1 Tax=Steinernema hermaphroditum TaxID=289476 RepID=A0AA39HW08_9BILA|nr:hypothetical protein QR680_006256 [Steinernema hermaphroditum]
MIAVIFVLLALWTGPTSCETDISQLSILTQLLQEIIDELLPLTCGPNANYSDCAGCDRICGGPEMMCAMVCRKGCSCNKGYVRNAIILIWICLRLVQTIWPGEVAIDSSVFGEASCPVNMIFSRLIESIQICPEFYK